MKKIFTFFLALVASVSAIYASDIKVGGIWYDFDNLSKTATVTYLGDSYDRYSNEYYGSVVIPSSVTYNGTIYSVTSIGDFAFYECTSLTSVTIGESVTSIGSQAFRDCSSLTSVTIPNSVTSIGNHAFYGCSSLTSVTIPNSVTSIGRLAFSCSSLASITIPNSVMVIGDEAFYDCSSLTSVTIGESVTSIGNGAFRDCSSLTKTNYTGDIAGWCNIEFGNYKANPMCYSHNFYINNQKIKNLVIPESVTSIGVYAFYDCSSLTSVTIGESVTSIGGEAFRNCSSLTSVTIGESVTSIGNYAFSGCSSLTSVTIPNSVTSIGDYAFYDCSSLTSVTIGESVTSIGMYAFNKCSSLTSVTIPNSVTSIGDHAFYDCSSLTSVTIGESVTSIGYGAFNKCSSLTSVTIGESVTSIGNFAFYECSSLTKTNYTGDIAGWCDIKFGAYSSNPISYSHNLYINDQEIKDLVIPNTVDSIHNYAFEGCSSLTSVTIGESVTSIGYDAFRDCSSLTSVTIGESVTSIGSDAFFDCSSLTSVTIGESVTSIGYDAFRDCSSLTKTNYTGDIAGWCNIKFGGGSANPMCYSHNFYINDQEIKDLVIPNTVDSIHNYAFEGCSSLTSVTIGESVTSIGYDAFRDCSSLTSVTIGESVTSIGDEAFYDCSSLTSVTIGESVTSIGDEAFYDCSSLTSVTIGESVTSIGEEAFKWCSSLTSVTINSDAIVSEDYKYNNISHIFGSQVTKYIIGGSVTSIGNMAFYKCSSLISVTIGESVTSIGSDAFFDCSSLTSVTIGESVTSIGSYAFYECSSLTSITCKAATPSTVGQYAFDDVSKSIPVYVPCESIQRYREHNEWGRFQNLQCVKPEDPNPEDPQDSEMCLNSADERAVFFQGEEFGTSANVYMWDPANDNKALVGSWPGSAATHLGDGKFKFVIPTSVTGDPSTWMIIWNNGIGGTQTADLTFTMHGLYNMSGVQGVITTLCDGSNTDDPNEEVITCAEAVSICQQTGTTATTKEYTIRGYVTKIEAAYSEQNDNITFWMADTSPTQMDNSSNSVTSISDYSNIALGKSTTASSSEDSGTLPEYINDGNFNTRWSSEWQDNEYITIDLEQYSFIDHITLHWEFAYASQFAILITDEQPSSSTLSSPLPSSATYYQSSGDVQTIPVAKSGRYITLIGIERATAYGISLYELEAYGAYEMPLLQAYCVKPIQSTDKYVQIGDYVEAVGTLVNYGGTTPEINAGGTYTILTTTTAVENTHIQSSMTNCQKIIRNGQLIILRDGKTYNVMGLEL